MTGPEIVTTRVIELAGHHPRDETALALQMFT